MHAVATVCQPRRGEEELSLLVATCSRMDVFEMDNFASSHAEIGVADPACCLAQSHYTDTWPTSPSSDPITPGRVATGVTIF